MPCLPQESIAESREIRRNKKAQSSFQLYLKPNGYIARFIRRDEKVDEEYYYLAYGDALNHLALFKNDNSGLYKRIEIVDSRSLRLP